MKALRKKWVVTLFFVLVSAGQAYPFAAAYAMTHQHAQCQCNQAGRECIHGCDLKKPKKTHHHAEHSDKPSEKKPCHSQVSKSSPQQSEKLRLKPAQEEAKLEYFVSPTCSKQHEKKVLSFQGDPFLLNPFQFTSFSPISFRENNRLTSLQEIELACDDPPPKDHDDSNT